MQSKEQAFSKALVLRTFFASERINPFKHNRRVTFALQDIDRITHQINTLRNMVLQRNIRWQTASSGPARNAPAAEGRRLSLSRRERKRQKVQTSRGRSEGTRRKLEVGGWHQEFGSWQVQPEESKYLSPVLQ